MVSLAIGLAIIVVFNLSVLFYKFYKKRYLDLFFDVVILCLLTKILGGSTLSLIIANIASFMMSIVLFFIPLKKIFSIEGALSTNTPKGRLKTKRYC